MALKRRGEVWWIDITVRGRRIQRSARTRNRQAAQEYHDRLASELWRERHVGDKPARSWAEAVVRFVKEKRGKKSLDRDIARFKVLDPYLGQRTLPDLDRDTLDEIAEQLTEDRELGPRGRNLYMALIRSVLRKAEREWGWIDRAPAVHMMKESAGRVRWLTREEYTRLMRVLPEHYRAAAEFTLQTGLRQANCFGLTWSRVDTGRRVAWVTAENTKNSKSLRVPLNDRALQVLKAQRGKDRALVFPGPNGQLRPPQSDLWRGWMEAAEIEDFRWHDLRHTWASWHVMAGTSLQELMELGGWSSYSMVLRYAHLAPAHLERRAANVEPPGEVGLAEVRGPKVE